MRPASLPACRFARQPARRRLLGPVVFAVSLLAVVTGQPSRAWSGSDSSNRTPRFETDVKPLFVAHCARCHGSQRHEASLDLTKREGVFRGSDSGPILTPGKPGDSLLFSVLHEGRMPPDKKSPLSASEIETVRRWIQAGAPTLAAAGGQAAAGRPADGERRSAFPSAALHRLPRRPQKRGRPRFAVAGGDAQRGKIRGGSGFGASGSQPDREKN